MDRFRMGPARGFDLEAFLNQVEALDENNVEAKITEHIKDFPGVSCASLEIALGKLQEDQNTLVREGLQKMLNDGIVFIDDDLGLQLK